jgi:hypothetical protein
MQRTGRANLTRLTCYRRTLAQVIEAATLSEPSHPRCQVLPSWRVRTFDTAFPPALSSRRNHHRFPGCVNPVHFCTPTILDPARKAQRLSGVKRTCAETSRLMTPQGPQRHQGLGRSIVPRDTIAIYREPDLHLGLPARPDGPHPCYTPYPLSNATAISLSKWSLV